MSSLFDPIVPLTPPREVMAEGALLLRGAALPFETDILTAIQAITAMSPFRHMVTPGGFVMSVAMKFALRHGDVAVWGGPSRLCYHGVPELKEGEHATVGRVRLNLTFRGAL
jgi:alkylated DNA repair dioxygenase AlkB